MKSINQINKEKRDILREKIKEVLFDNEITTNQKLLDLNLTADVTVDGTIIKDASGEIIATIEVDNSIQDF